MANNPCMGDKFDPLVTYNTKMQTIYMDEQCHNRFQLEDLDGLV